MALMRLIALLVVLESATMAVASLADFNIVNNITADPTPPLQVSCTHYGREVIPWQTIPSYQHVGLGFSPSIWGDTKYSCQFKWGDRTQSITVWYDKFFLAFWKKRPCNHCLWTVTEAGFYREPNGSSDKRSLVYKWN